MIRDKKTLDALALLRKAAYVKRFHTMPLIGDNTVGQHTFGVIALLCTVVPPAMLRPQLLQAAMLHDVPEAVVGDIPSPTKRSAPGLKQACDRREAEVLEEAGIVDISGYLFAHEEAWLTLADSLEGWLFCIEQLRMGNHLITEAAENFRSYVWEKFGALDGTDEAYVAFSTIIKAAENTHRVYRGEK